MSAEPPLPDRRADAPGPSGDEERSRLARLFDQAPVAVVIARGRVAGDLVFELANPRYLEMLPPGRDPLGQRVRDVLPDLSADLLAVLQRVLDTGEPFVATEYLVPLDRDGDGAAEDCFFNFVYHPLVEPDGAIDGIVGIGIEVTDSVLARRGAEALAARLRESESRLRLQAQQLDTIAQNATLALFIMDEHQQCTFMNAAAERLTGFTLDELRGKPLHYYIHHTRPDGRHYPLEECPIDRAFPQNMREQGEETFVHKDGTFYEVAFTASPIREGTRGNDRIIGTIIEVRDVREEKAREREREALLAAERVARTEAEAAREAAEAAARAKSDFLATMSHEIRTPINAIVGYTQLLELGLPDPPTAAQRPQLERISSSARHLLGIVDDVLDVAKLDAGAVRVAHEHAATGPAIEAALELARPLAAARGVRLVSELDGAGAPFIGDTARVRQILVNLLSNAVKFTDAGGTIVVASGTVPDVPPSVRVQGIGPWAFVRVSDTGIGIAPEQQATVFEPFVQAESGRTRTKGGTGLGLTISRRLARLMGGDLTLESVPGEGSTFTLWLPAAGLTDAGDAETPSARGERAGLPGAGWRVHGLAEIGLALRDETDAVLESYTAALRADRATPLARTMPRPHLEDHAITLLSDLAQSLVIIADAGDEAGALLGDGSAIQRTIAEHHGMRRFAQGWSEDAVARDHDVLRETVERMVRSRVAARAGDVSEGLRVLARLQERTKELSLAAYRHAAESHAAVIDPSRPRDA